MDVLEFTPFGFDGGFLNNLETRDNCVQCPATPAPCPVCPTGQVCIQRAGNGCTVCAHRVCVPAGDSGATYEGTPQSTSSGPNIGAIVGGIVGGLVFIAALTYLIWRFCIKQKREQYESELASQYEQYEQDAEKDRTRSYAPTYADRQSAITRSSIASTAFTRSSNVIQIAFFPGVAERSQESVPPVPPIPIPTSGQHTPYADSEGVHYFTPSVFQRDSGYSQARESAYSGFSTDSGRESVVRQSMAPSISPSLLRQSVVPLPASTPPAQTALRGKAAVVSVKSSGTASPASPSTSPQIPAVPTIDYQRYGGSPVELPAGSPTTLQHPGVGLSSASPVGSARTPTITVTDDAFTQPAPTRMPTTSSVYTASDLGATPDTARSPRTDLETVIEEATRTASELPTHGGLGSVRTDENEPSPFSDEHAVTPE